jgi:chemotaxis signal transduction protein
VRRGYLLVQVEGARYGLPLGPVRQVDDLGEVMQVPHILPAMRGLTPVGGRLVPLIHVGALRGNRLPPSALGRATVLVDLGGGERLVALEVDDADEVFREAVMPAPPGESLPWASGVARREGRLVPILDWSVLEERIK